MATAATARRKAMEDLQDQVAMVHHIQATVRIRATVRRLLATVDQLQATGDQLRATAHRLPATARPQATSRQLQATGRLKAMEDLQPAMDHHLPVMAARLLATASQVPDTARPSQAHTVPACPGRENLGKVTARDSHRMDLEDQHRQARLHRCPQAGSK